MKVTFLRFALQSKNLILLEGFGQPVVTVYISQPGVSYGALRGSDIAITLLSTLQNMGNRLNILINNHIA